MRTGLSPGTSSRRMRARHGVEPAGRKSICMCLVSATPETGDLDFARRILVSLCMRASEPNVISRIPPRCLYAVCVHFQPACALRRTGQNFKVVGPPGLEPGTKGFACSDRFRSARTISSPFAETSGVRDARACDQGRCSPQVVSAPSDGVPPAWLRVATGHAIRAAEVSLNSSRSRPRITARRHLFDESPALTN
ncbi:hypothetical protein SAMN05216289_102105 [Dokdonella immobilis]|uniref:Uncharacterized protein n=1 Tax=Dokdonella immobilis TaxID=578942 RepID=A0A1I4VHW7_9GAMM|nr:hypothetical protein SAMN05216289_102105 [Dokdonella immobilis]